MIDFLYKRHSDEVVNLEEKLKGLLSKKKTPPGSVWRTIRGHKVLIGADGGFIVDKLPWSDKQKISKVTKLEEIKKLDDKLFVHNVHSAGDKTLENLYGLQGYHAKPKLVSKDDYAKLKKEGNKEVYRGVTDNKYIDSFKNSSKHYGGRGIYGNGTYTAEFMDTAAKYAKYAKGSVAKMLISKKAKVVDFTELRKEMLSNMRNLPDKLVDTLYHSRLRDLMETDPGAADKLYEKLVKKNTDYQQKVQSIFFDVGKYATLRGYDVIKVSEASGKEDYYIILNRGIITMEK